MEKKAMRTLFGTDGVRGKANFHPMTVEMALALGKAAAVILKRKTDRPRVVVGKDTRLSCYMFENALIAGFCSMGVDTLMVGPFPTPGVAFITRAYRANSGIVISASHNPFYDNGIKIFDADGYKLHDQIEEEIETLIAKNDFDQFLPKDHEIGRNKRVADADGRYIEYVKATFPKGKTLKGMKICLDCANGAAHRVAPLIFSELDSELYVTGNTPNGININQNTGSLHLETVRKMVIDYKADVGIALDGDGDRVMMVDEKGNFVDGDSLVGIAASDLKRDGKLVNNRVVVTAMTNFGVLQFLKEQGIEVISSKVGDRYVIQEMLSKQAYLGGEQSGHLIFLEHNTTGDGLVSALQILRIMQTRQMKLSELTEWVKKTPQTLLNVPVKQKPPLDAIKNVQVTIEEVKRLLGTSGRVFVRYSGTENLCRVLVEGPKENETRDLANRIARVLKEEIGA